MALLAVLLLAANLRVAVASLGVLLPQVQRALGLSDALTGVVGLAVNRPRLLEDELHPAP